MPRQHIDTLVNLSDATAKRRLQLTIGLLRDIYQVELKPVNPQRTNPQNAYFHGVVVQSLFEYLNDPGHGTGQRFTREQCKDMIVAKVLGVQQVINPATGEVVAEVRPSTAGLNIEQFSELIDGAILWLSEVFAIEVPQPEQFYQKPATAAAKGK